MALNALVDSFCHNQKKFGTERVGFVVRTPVYVTVICPVSNIPTIMSLSHCLHYKMLPFLCASEAEE